MLYFVHIFCIVHNDQVFWCFKNSKYAGGDDWLFSEIKRTVAYFNRMAKARHRKTNKALETYVQSKPVTTLEDVQHKETLSFPNKEAGFDYIKSFISDLPENHYSLTTKLW